MPAALASTVRAAGVLPRIPLYRSFRAFGWPELMPMAMSFVTTDRCNSLCKTCNIGRRYMDDPSIADDELSLEEYARFVPTIGPLSWVTVGGGEPFMRRDFGELVALILRETRPRVLNIPTNATLAGATVRALGRIASDLGETRLILNVSLDAVGARHDEVRGFRNNFELAMRTIERVRAIGDRRIHIGVNTVVSRHNIDDVPEVFRFVFDELRPDSYVIETAQIRPEYYNQGEDLEADTARVVAALDRFVARLKRERRHGVARLVKAFRIRYYQDIRSRLLSPRGHRCFSGFTTCYVMPTGEVWSNTQRADRMGNIRDHGHDFRALWYGAEAREARRRVRASPCQCETSNVSYTNMLMDVGGMPQVLWNLLRY